MCYPTEELVVSLKQKSCLSQTHMNETVLRRETRHLRVNIFAVPVSVISREEKDVWSWVTCLLSKEL